MALGRTAYTMISLTPLLLVAGLTLYRREEVLQRFKATFAVAPVITVAVISIALCTFRTYLVPQDWRVHVQRLWASPRAGPGTVGGL